MPDALTPTIVTIGHSSHTMEAFIALLRANGVTQIVDVRSVPYSKRNPHFNGNVIDGPLGRAGIAYRADGGRLGGIPADPAFYDDAGYVRYDLLAATPSFADALSTLLAAARAHGGTALMCGEGNPAGCHRHLLVSRALRERGVHVRHVLADGSHVDDAALAVKTGASDAGDLFSGARAWRSASPVGPPGE
jgi:uncharacterized protein (DUF488 family)